MKNLFADLMRLCASNEAFYFVDHVYEGHTYRVFTYRLASYTDFLLPGALECRGHTFRLTCNSEDFAAGELVSLPMQKFFNVGENPFTMDLDWSKVVRMDDKLDGSLISTVALPNRGEYIVKSKTSLSSKQARAADRLLCTEKYSQLAQLLSSFVSMGYTVNMEYMAPDNQIVIGYSEPTLKILNVRHNVTGVYSEFWHGLDETFIENFVCPFVPCNGVRPELLNEIAEMTGIEGYVFTFADGLKAKRKTKWYSNLHLQKEQVTNPRRLFESVIMEQSDDLKTLFLEDPQSIQRIEEMEVKAKALYNRLHKLVDSYYNDNKELNRKDYAISAKSALESHGVFGLAMNLYIGKDMGLKEFLIKNYKSFGIIDSTSLSND